MVQMVHFMFVCIFYCTPIKKQDNQAVKAVWDHANCESEVFVTVYRAVQEGGVVALWEQFHTMPGCLMGIDGK